MDAVTPRWHDLIPSKQPAMPFNAFSCYSASNRVFPITVVIDVVIMIAQKASTADPHIFSSRNGGSSFNELFANKKLKNKKQEERYTNFHGISRP